MSNNIFTVDVEEYYHAENILCSLPADKIDSLPGRLDIGVHKLLELLGRHNSKGTFFVLGCAAEKNKALIKEISNAGHEVASHGYNHIPVYRHTPLTFEEDLGKSIKILSDISGQNIIGYRATSFSFSEKIPWFFDVLMKHGIIYDSSVSLSLFRHCSKALVRQGYCKLGSGMLEFPVSFLQIGPLKGAIGGGYFRAYPYCLTKWGLGRAASGKNTPSLFYVHPWELDPLQPRLNIPPVKYLRHYFNLKNTEKKLTRLLTDIKFNSVASFLNHLK